jgi:hypothetical protein
VVSQLTKEDCQEVSQCSDPCLREGKEEECSKKECERNGVCQSEELFLQGKCVFPSNAYFSPACDSNFFNNSAIDNQLGCVSDGKWNPTDILFSFHFFSKESYDVFFLVQSCTEVVRDEQECKERDHSRWIQYNSSTKEECERVGGFGCLEIVTLRTWQSSYIFTNKSKDECQQEEATKWKQRLDFTPSRWITGTMRGLEWKKRKWKPRARILDSTINFPKLQNIVQGGINSVISDQARTEARCRYEGRLDALNTITCNCIQVEDKNLDQTEDICKADSALSGFGTICPGISITIRVPPVVVHFGDRAVKDPNDCVQVSITLISALNFQSYRVENFASSFVEPQDESNSFSFTNNQGLTIGQGM